MRKSIKEKKMKRRIGIISVILVLALLLSVSLVLLTSAEGTNEAQLILSPASGDATTVTGTFDAMAEELSEKVGTLGAGTATLKLLSDAAATKRVALGGTGVESVYVDLGGYTLDFSGITATEGGSVISAKDLAVLEIDGGYNYDAEVGGILVADQYNGVIALDSVAYAEIYDIDITYSADVIDVYGVCAKGTAGELILRNADVTHNALETGASPVLVAAVTVDLTVIGSEITASTDASIGVYAKGSTVRLERSKIAAGTAYRMAAGSWCTAVDTSFVASQAIFGGASDVNGDVFHGAGVSFSGVSILGAGATKDMIKLWYGTGSTLIDVPTANVSESLTVATAHAELAELESGKWTLVDKSGASYVTTVTIIPDRGEVSETLYNNILSGAGALGAAFDVKTVATAAVTKVVAERNNLATSLTGSGNGNGSLFLDFNGFDVGNKRAAHFFSGGGLFRLSIDGADAEGNVCTVKLRGYAGGLIYVNNADPESVVSFTNIDFVETNLSGRIRTEIANGKVTNGSANMIQLQDCRFYMDNVDFTYTGEDYGCDLTLGPDANNRYSYDYYYKSSLSFPMIYLQSTAFMTAENCNFKVAISGVAAEKGLVNSIPVVSHSTDSSIYFKNCEFDGVSRVGTTAAGSTNKMWLKDCKVNTVNTPFIGNGTAYPIVISDCDITLGDVPLASGNVMLREGDGNTVIRAENGVSGTHTFDGECTLVFDTVSGTYILMSGDNVTKLQINNKLFANGMVFQAGKPINVWGSCSTNGSVITVTLGDVSVTATVADGKWNATLPAMDYAKGLTLDVKEEGKFGGATYTDIDIGEVWVMAGQSNANFGAYKMEDFAEYKALADNYDNIRCFSIGASLSESVLDDFGRASWFDVNSKTLSRDDSTEGISAVGYVMATRLAVELEGNPTIAIIDLNYNGKAISNFISNAYDPMASSSAAEHQIYNAMIAPLQGYNIKGMGWYQGEATADASECDEFGDGYYGLNIDQLYATFTDTCNVGEANDPLELFIVQLPAHMGAPSFFRAYQESIASGNDHYHLVGANWVGSTLSKGDFKYDAGDGFQYGHVHAVRKSPIGLAMADSILENVYFKDDNVVIANPEVEEVVTEGAEVKVTLDRDFVLLYGDEIEGFEIAGEDKVFVPAKATAEGRTITLTADGITEAKYVRYGFGISLLELENGDVIRFVKDGYTYDKSSGTVTIVASNGKTYYISVDDPEVIRSRVPGNVVGVTGHSLHTFSTAVDSSSADEN